MLLEDIWSHYGMWGGVLFFVVLYGLFILFTPFYRKSQWKPVSAYLAFIVAFAVEMHGLPFSMYIISWLFGYQLPEGILWGHTLQGYIGLWGMYVGLIFVAAGGLLVFFGWRDIYRNYWSKDSGEGQLVTKGIYARIRNPQYTGFLLISLGMICEWATIPLILMWPMMAVLYYRLAKREERDMEREFGEAYLLYKRRTAMFLPLVK